MSNEPMKSLGTEVIFKRGESLHLRMEGYLMLADSNI